MNSTNTKVQLPSIKSLLNSIDSQPKIKRSDNSLNSLASAANDIRDRKNVIPITTTPTLQSRNSLSHLHVPKVQTENSISKLINPTTTTTTTTTTKTTAIIPGATDVNYTIKQETNNSREQILIPSAIKTNAVSAEVSEEIRRKSEPLNKKSIDRRQSRSNLPKETIQVLNSWLLNHLNNPYPTAQEKRELLIKTGLTKIQLSNWFINVRRRKIFNDYYNLAKRQQNDDAALSIHNDYVRDNGDTPSTEVPLTRRKKLIDRLRELKKLTNEE